MKYTTEMQLAEIPTRADRLRERQERRVLRSLSASAVSLLLLLCFCVGSFAARGPTGAAQLQYGSFLLSPEAGGYVLAAVLAFALGVVVTLLIHQRRARTQPKQQSQEQE